MFDAGDLIGQRFHLGCVGACPSQGGPGKREVPVLEVTKKSVTIQKVKETRNALKHLKNNRKGVKVSKREASKEGRHSKTHKWLRVQREKDR